LTPVKHKELGAIRIEITVGHVVEKKNSICMYIREERRGEG
jgi:hypothetical protein